MTLDHFRLDSWVQQHQTPVASSQALLHHPRSAAEGGRELHHAHYPWVDVCQQEQVMGLRPPDHSDFLLAKK